MSVLCLGTAAHLQERRHQPTVAVGRENSRELAAQSQKSNTNVGGVQGGEVRCAVGVIKRECFIFS